MNSLFTIEEYDKSYQAQVAVLALEQSGIQCYLQNETIVAMDWFMANAVGGIQLQVAAIDAERAQSILSDIRKSQRERELQNKDKWIAFQCGRCKKPIAFSGGSLGRVENCPSCGKYVDVPYESDPGFDDELIEKTIHETKVGEKLFSAGFSSRTYLLGEIFLVLCFAYFRELHFAVQTYVHFFWNAADPSDYAEQIENQESFYGLLLVRSLFVITCMAPILLLNGLKRREKEERPQSWLVDSWIGVLLGLGAFCISWLIWSSQIGTAWETPNDRLSAGLESFVFWFMTLLFSLIANSIAEELVMRAYLIDRLERLFGNEWSAVLVSAVLFGSYHLYQGFWVGFVGATLTGLIFAVYFARYRRLFPLIIAHTIVNLLCVFLF